MPIGIAEFERSLIRKRREGRDWAGKRKRTKCGRSTVFDVGRRRVIAERYDAGEGLWQSEHANTKGQGDNLRVLN